MGDTEFTMSIRISANAKTEKMINPRNHNLSSYSLIVMNKAEKSLARGRRDMLTGQKRNKANAVSFSNKKSRKWQQVNIRNKYLYWPEGERFVKLRISARSIRTVEKKGLSVMAK